MWPWNKRSKHAKGTEEIGLSDEAADAAIVYEHGWVYVDWSVIKTSPAFEQAARDIMAKREVWLPKMSERWWHAIHPRPSAQHVQCGIQINRMDESHREEWMRLLTASSLIFDERMLQKYYCFDVQTVELILKYEAAMQVHTVKWDEYTAFREYVQLPYDLMAVISWMCSEKNAHWSNKLWNDERINSWVAHALIRHHWQVQKLSGDIDLVAARKILTAGRLSVGLGVPFEMLYVDVDVYDWVHGTGHYEPYVHPKVKIKG